jgi:hypothetical protein
MMAARGVFGSGFSLWLVGLGIMSMILGEGVHPLPKWTTGTAGIRNMISADGLQRLRVCAATGPGPNAWVVSSITKLINGWAKA